jgi:hypothetical protein
LVLLRILKFTVDSNLPQSCISQSSNYRTFFGIAIGCEEKYFAKLNASRVGREKACLQQTNEIPPLKTCIGNKQAMKRGQEVACFPDLSTASYLFGAFFIIRRFQKPATSYPTV